MTTYHYVLASKKFMLDDEPTHEIIKERNRDYQSKEKAIDFWVIEQPVFLDAPELAELKAKVPQPAAAIVSTDKSFITWLKLRLEFVAIGEVPASVSEAIYNGTLNITATDNPIAAISFASKRPRKKRPKMAPRGAWTAELQYMGGGGEGRDVVLF